MLEKFHPVIPSTMHHASQEALRMSLESARNGASVPGFLQLQRYLEKTRPGGALKVMKALVELAAPYLELVDGISVVDMGSGYTGVGLEAVKHCEMIKQAIIHSFDLFDWQGHESGTVFAVGHHNESVGVPDRTVDLYLVRNCCYSLTTSLGMVADAANKLKPNGVFAIAVVEVQMYRLLSALLVACRVGLFSVVDHAFTDQTKHKNDKTTQERSLHIILRRLPAQQPMPFGENFDEVLLFRNPTVCSKSNSMDEEEAPSEICAWKKALQTGYDISRMGHKLGLSDFHSNSIETALSQIGAANFIMQFLPELLP
jgi:hypothetical protein